MTATAIKRALWEWLTIGLASATVGLFAFWVVSATSTRSDFVILFDNWKELSAAGGTITVKNRINNLDEFEFLKKPGVLGPATFFEWDAPGVAIRRIEGNFWRWFVRVSLLIPTLACAALTVGCFWFCRRAWRKWHAELTKVRVP
jgi:hypothetical protein